MYDPFVHPLRLAVIEVALLTRNLQQHWLAEFLALSEQEHKLALPNNQTLESVAAGSTWAASSTVMVVEMAGFRTLRSLNFYIRDPSAFPGPSFIPFPPDL